MVPPPTYLDARTTPATSPALLSYHAMLAPGITSTGKGKGSAASPITGTATLTEWQAAKLAAGKYFDNVHTVANKGGEIRGTIVAQ